MSTIPPARPIGTVADPAHSSIRPALAWEARPDTSHPGHVGEWRDIRYEVGFPENTNGAIAKITICRPEVRNAFRPQTLQELSRAFDIARDDPDVGVIVAEAVGAGKYSRGILVCGTGAGMAIVANKVPGVRAVCVNDPYTAERAVASNNAQIITFGTQVIAPAVAKKYVDIWLESEYQGGRSAPKVAKIDNLDDKYRK